MRSKQAFLSGSAQHGSFGPIYMCSIILEKQGSDFHFFVLKDLIADQGVEIPFLYFRQTIISSKERKVNFSDVTREESY